MGRQERQGRHGENDERYSGYHVRGSGREERKERRYRKEVDGQDVTGTFRNKEGQEMAKILFKFKEGRWPEGKEAADYAKAITKGHEISISEIYYPMVGQYGNGSFNLAPSRIRQILLEEDERVELERLAQSWTAGVLQATPGRRGNVIVTSNLLPLEGLDVYPSETVIQIQERMYAQLLGENCGIRFTSFDPDPNPDPQPDSRDDHIEIYDCVEQVEGLKNVIKGSKVARWYVAVDKPQI